MFTMGEYVYEIMAYNDKNGTSFNHDVAKANVQVAFCEETNTELNDQERFFYGDENKKIIKLYNGGEVSKEVFIAEVDKMFADYSNGKEFSFTRYDKDVHTELQEGDSTSGPNMVPPEDYDPNAPKT